MQSSAPGEEQLQAPVQAGSTLWKAALQRTQVVVMQGGVFVDELNTSQQCTLVGPGANSILGYLTEML